MGQEFNLEVTFVCRDINLNYTLVHGFNKLNRIQTFLGCRTLKIKRCLTTLEHDYCRKKGFLQENGERRWTQDKQRRYLLQCLGLLAFGFNFIAVIQRPKGRENSVTC